MGKTPLFVISTHPDPLLGECWTDDGGGSLFVTRQMAERCRVRHHLWTCIVVPCGLDDGLAQMSQLYHEPNPPTH